MSIKGFLQAKEMQTGGMLQSFTGPFANQEKRNPSGPGYIPPSYEPPKPPTITLPPITPPPPAAPTAEEIAKLDPGTVGSHADYNYNVTDAIAGASKAGMGNLTPAQIGMLEPEFAASLAATVQPETDLSRFTDKAFKSALTPALAVATLAVPAVAPMAGLFSAVTGRGGSGILGSALSAMGSKPAAQTAAYVGTPATSLINTGSQTDANNAYFNYATGQGAGNKSVGSGTGGRGGPSGKGVNIFAPGGAMDQARSNQARANQTGRAYGEATVGPTPAFASLGTAGVGAAMFGAYGMGGEISPNFAIGGKGSFTSFAHYGAGISQADEINIVENSAPGVFASPESGKDAVDGLVSGGYSESEITAIAQTGEYAGLDYAEGSKDDGSSQSIGKFAIDEGKYQDSSGGDFSGGADSVICQELYDQGLLEHSIYSLDEQFGEHIRKHDSDLLEGYHTWAYNVVNAMRKSKTITHIVRIVSRPVVKHIAYKMGYPSKTLLGAVMFNVGAFVCRRLAKKETVYA